MGPTRVTAAVPTPSHPLQTCVTGKHLCCASKFPHRSHKSKKKARPHASRREVGQFLIDRVLTYDCDLRLRLFCHAGLQEHSPGTCNSGCKQIHCRGTTLGRLLLVAALLARIASATAVALVGQCYRRQTTNQERCHPPICFTIAHFLLPWDTNLRSTWDGEYRGIGTLPGDSVELYPLNGLAQRDVKMIVFATVA
jgi:hypothetical protein